MVVKLKLSVFLLLFFSTLKELLLLDCDVICFEVNLDKNEGLCFTGADVLEDNVGGFDIGLPWLSVFALLLSFLLKEDAMESSEKLPWVIFS